MLDEELKGADDFHKNNLIFSYKEDNISFTNSGGTEVNLDTCESFKTWFAQLPLKQAISLDGNFVLFKLNENTIAINSGPGTAGIQVKKKDHGFIACNNLTADRVKDHCTATQLFSLRKDTLVTLLAVLRKSVKTIEEKKVEEIKEPTVETRSPVVVTNQPEVAHQCSIQ